MALSMSDDHDTVPDLPVIAQHYLVCGTKDCKKNCQFYCNPCHLPLCEQCRDEHQKSQDTKNHEVVPYREHKIKLPVEKCKDHPNKDIDMLCEYCQVPVCSKCATQDHQNHTLKDLETIYSEKCTLCHKKIYKIHQFFIPNSQVMLEDIEENAKDIKEIMENIRRSIKNENESLKFLMEAVTSDRIQQVNKMEESLIEELKSQDKTYQDYISYLEDLVKVFHGYLFSTEVVNNPIILSLSDRLKIKPIPETVKPVPPVFTAGQYNKEEVTKLLGRVTVPDTKPENRKIKPLETASTQYNIRRYSLYLMGFLLLFFLFMSGLVIINNHTEKQNYQKPENRKIKPMETASTQLKLTEKQRKEDREKSDMKQTLSLSSSVTKVKEYTVPGIDSAYHMLQGKSGRLWVSDITGNLVQTDLQDNELKQIQSSVGIGYHTVTRDGDMLYTDRKNNVINRITPDNTITKFINTGDWKPISIHSSHINGDILVGMIKGGKAKVTRYNKKGEEIQNIQRDNKGQELFSYPRYITENINGDICTSDYHKQTLVVVDKSGQHRFSYTGQGTLFRPFGICTDLLGQIIVCDAISKIIYLLDQNGQFLISLLTPQQLINRPISVCVDDENNLHVGHWNTSTVTVYKYLQ